MYLKDRFATFKMNPCDTVAIHIQKLRSLVDQMNVASLFMSKQEQILGLNDAQHAPRAKPICSLTPNFEFFCVASYELTK